MQLDKLAPVGQVLDELLGGIHGVTCFKQTLRIVAPTSFGKQTDAVIALRDRIVTILEGATVYEASGCWTDKKRRVVLCEPNLVIEAAHNCVQPKQAQLLADAILEYAQETNQDQLGIQNGSFYLADTSKLRDMLEEKRSPKFRLPGE